jgi:hypothetical protein
MANGPRRPIPPEETALARERISELARALGYRAADGMLQYGALAAVAAHLGIGRAAIQHAWIGRRRLPAIAKAS